MDAQRAFELGAEYLEKKNLDNALIAFQETVRIDPSFAQGYNGLGVTYSLLGEYPKALLACCEAIRLDPKEPEFYRARGYVYERMGDEAAAEADLAKAEALEAAQG